MHILMQRCNLYYKVRLFCLIPVKPTLTNCWGEQEKNQILRDKILYINSIVMDIIVVLLNVTFSWHFHLSGLSKIEFSIRWNKYLSYLVYLVNLGFLKSTNCDQLTYFNLRQNHFSSERVQFYSSISTFLRHVLHYTIFIWKGNRSQSSVIKSDSLML